MGSVVFWRGVPEDEVGDCDGEVRAFSGLAARGFDAVDVGEGYDVASPEDFYAAAISE